jgi:tetratricopeptide (TPR) repeat protein
MDAHHPLQHLLAHAGEPRTEHYVERPGPWGKLRLDIPDERALLATWNGMTPAQEDEARGAFELARSLFNPEDPQPGLSALSAVAARWPLWGAGHAALCDAFRHLGEHAEASYHARQLLAVVPDAAHVLKLAVSLAREGNLPDARALQEHVWTHRASEPDETAYQAACDLLVTLTRLKGGAQMVVVAEEALAAFPGDATLAYQRLLGLMLADRRDEALAGCEQALASLEQDAPLRPRFEQMRAALAGG